MTLFCFIFLRYYFPCQRWLATDKDDGQIARDLIPVEKEAIQRSLQRKKSTTSLREEFALETKGMQLCCFFFWYVY